MNTMAYLSTAKRALQFQELTLQGFRRFSCRKIDAGDSCLTISKDLNDQTGGGISDDEGATIGAGKDQGSGDADPEPDSRPSNAGLKQLAPALLPFHALSAYVSFGRSRIYQLIQDGSFPPPIKIGKSSRWLMMEVDAWVEQHINSRQLRMEGGRSA